MSPRAVAAAACPHHLTDDIVSHQLESVHYLRSGDEVRHQDGRTGRVQEALTLYAVVRWDGAGQEEVDQLDPRVFVVERATSG